MFKISPSQPARPTTPPRSVDDLRRRAKHRLMGATVLVVAGVVVFPWLFDNQPRPIPVDIPVNIPSRNTSTPLQVTPPSDSPTAITKATGTETLIEPSSPKPPAQPPVPSPVAAAPAVPVIKPSPPPPPAEVRKDPPPAPKPVPAPAPDKPKPPEKPTERPVEKPVAKPAPAPRPSDDGARALALLTDQPRLAPPASVSGTDAPKKGASTPSSDSDKGRFIVQVGAFADADKAQQVRQKLERAGLKTYTHVAETPEGQRIRVRLGPFANRGEADQAAAKAKAQGLAAAVLSL